MAQYCYKNNSKFSHRQFLANGVDPDQSAGAVIRLLEQSVLGLHCLSFFLHTHYSVRIEPLCSN